MKLLTIMANKMTRKNQYYPHTISHPGVTLSAKIHEMGMTIREFAAKAHKTEKSILDIIRGNNSIDSETAMVLENITNIPSGFWMSRQRIYDEFIARKRIVRKIEAQTYRVDCLGR